MKASVILLLAICCYTVMPQSLTIFNLNTGDYPNMKALFYAKNQTGEQYKFVEPSDFILTEDNLLRKITKITCPDETLPGPVSAVFVVDVSLTMNKEGLNLAKTAAHTMIDSLSSSGAECAITKFAENSVVHQAFTTDYTLLHEKIESLVIDQSNANATDFNKAMLQDETGGIDVALQGKHKKIMILISDGDPTIDPEEATIIDKALENEITIYCICLSNTIPKCMKNFSEKTGGKFYNAITTEEQAKSIFLEILESGRDKVVPCTIEWESVDRCDSAEVNVKLWFSLNKKTSSCAYFAPANLTSNFSINPSYIIFSMPKPGLVTDSVISITSKNATFNVSNVTSTNPSFSVTPSHFTLYKGQTINLTVSFVPVDSGFTFTNFIFETDKCEKNYFVCGGFPGKRTYARTLKLIRPNGGEYFVVGSDTLITWQGVSPEEKVKVEFTTNNGTNWIEIADSVEGLSYLWHIPKTPSWKCMARVTARLDYLEGFDVMACGKTWMSSNLNVDHYRNGDSIPQVTDLNVWKRLSTGAWCYYNNDPATGEIFGRLYNWYALNDSRGLAPEGWHISTLGEWNELANCLGGIEIAGGALKNSIYGIWMPPNTGATDKILFSALPGGARLYNDVNMTCYFSFLNYTGFWWTSTNYPLNSDYGWVKMIGYDRTSISQYNYLKESGFSVRCVKD